MLWDESATGIPRVPDTPLSQLRRLINELEMEPDSS